MNKKTMNLLQKSYFNKKSGKLQIKKIIKNFKTIYKKWMKKL